MSWAHVCKTKMYRSGTLFLGAALWAAVGCQKPTSDPPVEPAVDAEKAEEVAKEVEKKPEQKPETAKAEAEEKAVTQLIIKDVGFKTPESVYYDEKSDLYLVSNINGSPTETDNNGFISKVSPEGKVIALTWIAGGQNDVTLNAPKGMVVKDDVLYVTDITTIRMFDMASGASKGEIAIEKATFLNDLTKGEDGTIYVSDSGLKSEGEGLISTGTDAIYTIKENKAEKLIASKELNAPNGLWADEGGLWVVTHSGTELYRVTADGKKETPVTIPGGGLDGLVKTRDGDLLISSWQAKTIFQGLPKGGFNPLLAGITSPADIGYDSKRHRVLVPVFLGDAVQIQDLQTATALRSDAPEPEVAAEKAEADEKAAEVDAEEKPEEAKAEEKPAKKATP